MDPSRTSPSQLCRGTSSAGARAVFPAAFPWASQGAKALRPPRVIGICTRGAECGRHAGMRVRLRRSRSGPPPLRARNGNHDFYNLLQSILYYSITKHLHHLYYQHSFKSLLIAKSFIKVLVLLRREFEIFSASSKCAANIEDVQRPKSMYFYFWKVLEFRPGRGSTWTRRPCWRPRSTSRN